MHKDKEQNNDHNLIDKENLPNPVSNDNDLHIKDEVFDNDVNTSSKDKEDKK